jgi:hypothetical protein
MNDVVVVPVGLLPDSALKDFEARAQKIDD